MDLQRLCKIETRSLFCLVGMIALSVLVFQTTTFPCINGLNSIFPSVKVCNDTFTSEESSGKSDLFGGIPFSNGSNSNTSSGVLKVMNSTKTTNTGKESDNATETEGRKKNVKNDSVSEENSLENVVQVNNTDNHDDESSLKKVSELEKDSMKENVELPKNGSSIENGIEGNSTKTEMLPEHDKPVPPESNFTSSSVSTLLTHPLIKKGHFKPPESVMTISEMNSLLLKRRGSYYSVKAQWSTVRDQELLFAKSQIDSAPIVRNDQDLFGPVYRNVSMFKRSYELMERILKVYVYREGEKPIFHDAEFEGIYASEGWFMKQMEGSKKFVVRDPSMAHLFYMPFSSRMLQHALYKPNSHNRTILAQYLKNYTNMIAGKYSFWNRTSGTDHFLVACHDWAPFDVRHHMDRCIKSLCNTDVTSGFEIGKDVSLPETYVRSAKNPLRDIGGKPPSERPILAFFAGGVHGYLRRILLAYWENKDPDMKILGQMAPGGASKREYIQNMKSSKYCICAKGFNVNSPRVVEAISYECVPVIISDNFVPPFFEVLNWEAFSVVIEEKDIPLLKDILLSIPHEKYLALQLGVKKVQRHFLWHNEPNKYDLFYTILHSIWYNRVNTIRPT